MVGDNVDTSLTGNIYILLRDPSTLILNPNPPKWRGVAFGQMMKGGRERP